MVETRLFREFGTEPLVPRPDHARQPAQRDDACPCQVTAQDLRHEQYQRLGHRAV